MQEAGKIAQLKSIIEEQMELLRLCLFVASEGPATFKGEELTCSLNEKQRRASTFIAMAAGQSVATVLKMSELRGIPVRDIYPIARSVVESFINAAFLASGSDEAADRAINYIAYSSWKHVNRTVGSGDFALEISTKPELSDSPFPEFNGKGNGVWTKLDLPSRIRSVGEAAGKKSGSRLLGAYALIYSISSEIIHGSPYGVSYFYHAHLPDSPTVDDFRTGTEKQIEDVLFAVIHGAAGYLSTFFELQNMSLPTQSEQHLFNRLLELEGISPQEVQT